MAAQGRGAEDVQAMHSRVPMPAEVDSSVTARAVESAETAAGRERLWGILGSASAERVAADDDGAGEGRDKGSLESGEGYSSADSFVWAP